MKQSPEAVVRQLTSHLREQASEMIALRKAIDAQFQRIATMQTALLLNQPAHARRAAAKVNGNNAGEATAGGYESDPRQGPCGAAEAKT